MKTYILKSLAVITVILGTSATQAAPMNALQKVCAFAKGDKQSLKKEELQYLKSTGADSPDGIYFLTKFCKNPELKMNVGPITVYQNDQSIGIFQTGRTGNLAALQIATGNFDVMQVALTMDDGIQLPTFVFSPKGQRAKAAGTILMRTPYALSSLAEWYVAMNYTNSGFNVIFQPARGTYLAQGEFEWLNWKREAQDAKTTLDWISNQSWANKDIIAIGTSYDAFLAMAAGTTRHPRLSIVIAASGPWNPSADSLSANGLINPVLDYVTSLNWDGAPGLSSSGDSPQIQKMVKFEGKPTANSIVSKARNMFSLKLKSLTPEALNNKSDDFVEALKKAKALMIYGFGKNDDQDSREVINLAARLNGLKNHYFIAHTAGHSDTPITNTVLYAIRNGYSTPQISAYFNQNGSGHICNMNLATAIICKESLPFVEMPEEKFHAENLKITDENVIIKGLAEIDQDAEVAGQLKADITIDVQNAPESKLLMRMLLVVCQPDGSACKAINNQGAMVNTATSNGEHKYTLSSQHGMYSIPKGNLFAYFIFEDLLGKELKTKPKVIVKSLDLSLPAK